MRALEGGEGRGGWLFGEGEEEISLGVRWRETESMFVCGCLCVVAGQVKH